MGSGWERLQPGPCQLQAESGKYWDGVLLRYSAPILGIRCIPIPWWHARKIRSSVSSGSRGRNLVAAERDLLRLFFVCKAQCDFYDQFFSR